MEYYLEDKEKVLEALRSSREGLSSAEAAERLKQNGKNRLKEAEKRSTLRKFLDSITDPMILMLLGAALVQVLVTLLETRGSFTLGSFTDVFVILAVVIINAINAVAPVS